MSKTPQKASCLHGKKPDQCDLCFRLSRREKTITQKQMDGAARQDRRGER